MPIWLELTVLMLLAYTGGIAIGWALWAHAPADTAKDKDTHD